VPVQGGARPSLLAPALQIPVENQPRDGLTLPGVADQPGRIPDPRLGWPTRERPRHNPTADSNAIASAMRMTRSSRSSGRRRTSTVTRREVGKQPHHVQDDCVVFNRGWTGLDSSFLQRRPSQRGCSTKASRQATRGQCEQHRGHCIAARAGSFSGLPMVSRTAPKFRRRRGQRPVQSGQVLETFSTAWPPSSSVLSQLNTNWVVRPGRTHQGEVSCIGH